MLKLPHLVFVVLDKLTKTSKAGKPRINISLPSYSQDDTLCVVNCLKTYLQRTKSIRGDNRRLFLSYVPPHKAIGAETIGRWIKGIP